MNADYHLHTEFSDDSDTPIEAVVERAIALGLNEICITDHVDYGAKTEWRSANDLLWIQGIRQKNVPYSMYFARLDALRAQYGSRISIRSGLEFGMQTTTIPQYTAVVERYRRELDFVLLSVHEIDDLEFWNQDFQRGKTQEEYNLRYYRELLALVEKFKDYSALAHLDLLARYDQNGLYPFDKVRELVVAILERVILDGKGLEVNTSSWRYELGDTTPCREILRLYRDLGGRVLTLGSDAHTPGQIAEHFADARAILRDELGFKEICAFDKMTPTFHEL